MMSYRPKALKTVILVCALIFLLGVLSATAQSAGPTIKTASLSLLSEYDDPGLLVIFAGEFAEGTSFPADVTFSLPAAARNVQAAYPDANGKLLNADAEVQEGKLAFKQLPVAAFHIEYYVDRQPSGDQREVVHVFQAPFAIEALDVAVQQPARATDFSVSPASESSYVGQDGLTYDMFSRAGLAAGDTLEIVLRYVKTDSGVSRPQLAVTNTALTPAAPSASTATPARSGLSTWLPWVLIGTGVTALVGLATYWLLSRRRGYTPATAARRAAPQAPARSASKPTAGSATVFCTQCGHPLGRDDRFCAQCGAPRRS